MTLAASEYFHVLGKTVAACFMYQSGVAPSASPETNIVGTDESTAAR
jgi:hypothetical protein